jgi:hypothetical protein
MVHLQPDAVGVFEQQRVIAGRLGILARRADDFGAKRADEAMEFVDIGALASAQAEMMQATRCCSKGRPANSGAGALMPSAVRPPTQ